MKQIFRVDWLLLSFTNSNLEIFCHIKLFVFQAVLCLDIVPSSNGKKCSQDQVCATRESCPYWSQRRQEIGALPRSSPIYQAYVEDGKKAICNRGKRALCCPSSRPRPTQPSRTSSVRPISINGRSDPSNDPTYIPGPEDCGAIGNTQNIFGGKNPKICPIVLLLFQVLQQDREISHLQYY